MWVQFDVNEQRIRQVARIVKIIDIVEEFPLSGEEVVLRRRDLRRGPLRARTAMTPTGYRNRCVTLMLDIKEPLMAKKRSAPGPLHSVTLSAVFFLPISCCLAGLLMVELKTGAVTSAPCQRAL